MRGLRLWIAVAIAAGAVGAAPAGAAAATYSTGTDCHEQQAFVDGDPAVVEALLPDRYRAMTNPASGRPLVFARGLRCREMSLDGRSAPVVNASYGVLIDSPDGRGCGSASPTGSVKGDGPPVCNWYVLRWLSSDRRVVDWLREGTPGFPAVHVPGLLFDLGPFGPGGAPFSVRAGGDAPYTIDATAHENVRELAVRGGYWAETPQGTVKLALSSDDLNAADGSGVVRAPGGTPVARLMGAEERSYAPVYSAFASVHAGRGVYRKQILPPAGSKDGFAGTCSAQGTVNFKPPATNDSQRLEVDYEGPGTCTGTLDGRDLKDAPMRVHHSGRAEGGCRSAKTLAPFEGAMTFASGEVIRYTVDFTTTSTTVEATVYGERSGTAPARGSFLTDRTPPDVAVRCAGEGVSQTPLDVTFTTQSPLVNAPGGPPGPDARRRLRVSVSPRPAHTGTRTRFTIRVTAGGRPVEGANVRFAGRRLHTGRAGSATLTTAFWHPGPRRIVAGKDGFRVGRGTLPVSSGR